MVSDCSGQGSKTPGPDRPILLLKIVRRKREIAVKTNSFFVTHQRRAGDTPAINDGHDLKLITQIGDVAAQRVQVHHQVSAQDLYHVGIMPLNSVRGVMGGGFGD